MFLETVSGHNHTTRMSCEFAKCHAELSSDTKSWLYLVYGESYHPATCAQSNNLRNLVMNQSEEWNVIRVLKFWTLLTGVLNCYYSHGTKKTPLESWAFHRTGQCSRQKVQGQLAATFFLGGACFFSGVGCDKGFWNNMLVSSYVLLLFSAPRFFWVLRAGNCARICMM